MPSDSRANTVRTLIVAAVYSICKKRQKTIFPIHSDLMEANKTLRFFTEGIVNRTFDIFFQSNDAKAYKQIKTMISCNIRRYCKDLIILPLNVLVDLLAN